MRDLLSRFRPRKAPSLDGDDRVLHLFRKRAELKKERSDLQDEILRLKDSLEQQQGATAHVQRQLSRLEACLGDSVSGHHVLVFYQLRALWKSGSDALAALIGELSAQHEERERRDFFAAHNGRQFVLRESAAAALQAAQETVLAARAALVRLQQARSRATKWWQHFGRRALDAQIVLQTAHVEAAGAALDAARKAHEDLVLQGGPEFPGLSVAARRAVNLAAIVYAEILLMPLQRTPLQSLLSEAAHRREAPSRYGDPPECDALMAQIALARSALPTAAAVSAELRQRVELLSMQVGYDFPDDVLPTAQSVGSHALRDDYWGVRRLLLS